MMFLCVIFASPLYFLARKKWGQFVINAGLYVVALFCVLSLVFLPFGVFLWALSVVHGLYNLKTEQVEAQADLLAAKIAEKTKR